MNNERLFNFPSSKPFSYTSTMTYYFSEKETAGCQWLTPTILATQEEKIRGLRFKASQGNSL
jgi:hypothetical protein